MVMALGTIQLTARATVVVLGVVGIMGPVTVTVMGMGLGTVVATVLGTMKAGAMIEAPLT
jgi:hypothetical protein